jgi:hypothetical protein
MIVLTLKYPSSLMWVVNPYKIAGNQKVVN